MSSILSGPRALGPGAGGRSLASPHPLANKATKARAPTTPLGPNPNTTLSPTPLTITHRYIS